jgi:hypothetical protein
MGSEIRALGSRELRCPNNQKFTLVAALWLARLPVNIDHLSKFTDHP